MSFAMKWLTKCADTALQARIDRLLRTNELLRRQSRRQAGRLRAAAVAAEVAKAQRLRLIAAVAEMHHLSGEYSRVVDENEHLRAENERLDGELRVLDDLRGAVAEARTVAP